jgi:hypothetical protein
MKLADVVQLGDWLIYYPKKDGFLANMIRKVTAGPVIHVAMVKDSETLFETDGDTIKATYTKLEDVEGRRLLVVRPKGLEGRGPEIVALMEKFKGLPYGYWDIGMMFLFSWLAAPIRKKLVEFTTAKPFMVCSELVARITYEITKRKELEEYEALTPEDLRVIALMYPAEYTIVHEHNSPEEK